MGEMDIATFELECERLKQLHAKKAGPPEFQKDSSGCPTYLQKIKANLADQQQSKLEKNSSQIPAGYRVMPEQERLETLEALQKKRKELDEALKRLPFNIETQSQRRREQSILK